MQQHASMSGGMGADCPAGTYNAWGFCVPNLKTLVQGAQAGAISSIASGAAQSPATAQAVESATASAVGNKIIDIYKRNPTMTLVIAGLVGVAVIYGVMSFVRGR
jgi:hypothetical protein